MLDVNTLKTTNAFTCVSGLTLLKGSQDKGFHKTTLRVQGTCLGLGRALPGMSEALGSALALPREKKGERVCAKNHLFATSL
jgi:hypothetical protein